MVATDVVDWDWVAAHVGDPDVRLVEVDVSRAAYDAGHIPGAVPWGAYSDLRGRDYRPVSDAAMQELLSQSGIGTDTTVVFYGYAAALGYWLMRTYGHRSLGLIERPRAEWGEFGTWERSAPDVPKTPYPALVNDGDLLATQEQIEAAMSDPDVVILDVRSEDEYDGGRFWPSGATVDAGWSGHVPGAISIPIDSIRAADGVVVDQAKLRQALDQAGVTSNKRLITYCTIGNRASQVWFALTAGLGLPNAAVYYGSWAEWGKLPSTPIER